MVGEIPDGTGEATVEVTYEDGSKENVKVQITVTPSDATTVTPTVTPLTRHDQAPKHTEAQVTGAVTGDKITGKRVVGEIPDGTGEATVEVTYEDGSSETVKVPITVVGLPKTKVLVESFGNLTKEEQDKVKESVEKANPGKTVIVEPSGKVIITDPKTNISHEISEELVTTIAPPVVDIPEFNGGVNGEQQDGDNKPQPTPGVPTDNTERKPEVVTPDEQPDETENTTTKPKASQNILPNTGTADGLGIFSAAAASILAGLGLIIPVKKEDEEEEETQNN